MPPLTDVIGHLLETGPTLRVRTKRGDVVEIAADDVVAIKALAAAPVRTRDIRNLEHAAALGWPGAEQQWLGGWLLRYGHGSTRRNSAVPLDVYGSDVDALIDWQAARGVAPLVAAPDRLFASHRGADRRRKPGHDRRSAVGEPDRVATSGRDDEWLRLYR